MLQGDLLRLTARIVVAYFTRNAVAVREIPKIMQRIHHALEDLEPVGALVPDGTTGPAVSIGRSVARDYIVCLEDGQRLKTLTRHLRTQHNLTPREYRVRWNLSSRYPMVAPTLSEHRAMLARRDG